MRKIIGSLALGAMVFCATAVHAGEFQVKMVPQQAYQGGQVLTFMQLKITSMSDKEEIIRKVVFNRGNCQLYEGDLKMFPKKLKYGESLLLGKGTCDELLEVAIEADSGGYKFKFNN